jgi:hypothetical protein
MMDKVLQRFENNIFYSPCGCHYWIGNQRKKQGYGGFRYNGKMMLAHRVSYLLNKGEIGDKHVLHSCDNPYCVNPDHLFLGTHQDNMSDMKKKGRGVSLKGSDHYASASEFTDQEVLSIKKQLRLGVKQSHIAALYGVHKTTIQGIASGKSWKHIQL